MLKRGVIISNLTYAHSGALGDLIYSLPVVKHFGKGDFYVKLRSMEYTATKYGYRQEHKQPFHLQKLSEEDFKLLAPLLEAQPYIINVISTDDSAMQATYDLDSFRGVLWRSFVGNYVEAYFKTFNIPYTAQDIVTPWLVAEPKEVAPIVIARTLRHRDPNSLLRWKDFTSLPNFKDIAVFVGHDDEYEDLKNTFDTSIPRYIPKDFLDLAQIVSGAQHIVCNGTFVYSLAQALGKPTTLETLKDRTLSNNECFFNRSNCFYF